MKKQEALELITEIFSNLKSEINSKPDEIKISEIIAVLSRVSNNLIQYDEEQTDFRTTQLLYQDEYKRIAKESLRSYQDSNDQFMQINDNVVRKHQDSVTQSAERMIDISEIAHRFEDIQNHLHNEVTRANSTIHELVGKVKELEERSNIDPLTLVYNRYALKQHIMSLSAVSDRLTTMYVLLLDIDDFKIVNDTYGHVAGDKVLIFVAKILKKALRDGDKIFRYGGEEFLIILNRINAEETTTIGERILHLIRSNKLLFKNQQLSITASIGATRYQKDDTLESIIERSDKALYKAKKSGKDRMEMEQ